MPLSPASEPSELASAVQRARAGVHFAARSGPSMSRGSSSLPKLYWFHGYKCRSPNDVAEIVEVMRDGPVVPSFATKARQNEAHLGLSPSVYCYLGRAHETFGEVVFAFSANPDGGMLSPFDTGSLNKYAPPVSDWQDPEKKTYLAAYSWSIAELADQLLKYPGTAVGEIERYLNVALKPLHTGPHGAWPGRQVANIWERSSDWRSWTWEGRWPEKLSFGVSLEAWTCSPAQQGLLLDWATQHASDEDRAWFGDALPKFIEGGFGELAETMRVRQESA